MSKMEHLEEEYLKINPNGKVPAMVDTKDGFNFSLFESHAIMKYICRSRNLPDTWYPSSDQRNYEKQAKMDIYLDYHHAGVRLGCAGYFFKKYLSGILLGVWAT